MSEAEKERCVEDGRNWWHGLNDDQQHGFSEARKQAWQKLSKNVQEDIVQNLGIHAQVARVIRMEEAEERYNREGEFPVKLGGIDI